METLERSRVCRLCGKQAGMTIDIFGKRGNHVKQINMILPILVHEMDLLPKHMCHPCNYKLQEFYKFYEGCIKTDTDLKSQLSWMQGPHVREEIIVPMVQINNIKIKTEPFDYGEQMMTETMLNRDKMSNLKENHYTSFRENFEQFTNVQCPKCGYYCENNNYVNDDVAKNCTRTRSRTHAVGTKNTTEYSSRDSIRRNLFATEIFHSKNPKVHTEISNTNLSKQVPKGKGSKEMRSFVRLNRLSVRQNSVAVSPKIEIPEISKKISFGTFRSKNSVAMTFKNARSPSGTFKSTKNKLNSHKIIRQRKCIANCSDLIDVKKETMDRIERSLRPRTEAINYSETKRRNRLARTSDSERGIKKIKISPRNSDNEEYPKQTFKNSTTFVNDTSMKSTTPSSILLIKLERENYTDFSEQQSNNDEAGKSVKMSIKSRNKREEIPKVVTKKEIVDNDINTTINRERNIQHFIKAEPRMINSETKNLIKDFDKSKYCLRSRIEHSRNSKLKKIQSIVDSRGITKDINRSPRFSSTIHPRFSLNPFGEKQSRNKDKIPATISKNHQECYFCKKTFASLELYKLHPCYTN